jgi:hypothetical protein
MKRDLLLSFLIAFAAGCNGSDDKATDGGSATDDTESATHDSESATEDNGDLVAFESAGCDDSGRSRAPLPAGFTPVDAASYDDMSCVSWAVGDKGTLLVDVINAFVGCGLAFEGSAVAGDAHTLTLGFRQEDCSVDVGCTCPYDFSFEATGVATDADLALTIERGQCPSGALCDARLTLPLASQPSGVRCRYAGSADVMEGTPYATCIATGQPVEYACDDGLVCTDIAGFESPICLPSCHVESDCPAQDVLSCSGGACRLDDPLPRSCDDSAMTDCEGGLLDPTTNLCWQDPPGSKSMVWQTATTSCEDLDLGGHTDWRLPTIGELRSLIRGCAATETGGACGVTDDCLDASCSGDACYGCDSGAGPSGGCYWPSEMAGDCGGFWSSSPQGDSADLVWGVSFGEGFVYEDANEQAIGSARCVRNGP